MKNIQKTPTTILEDIPKIIRRKYVQPESSASAKHTLYRLIFDSIKHQLLHCLENIQKNAEEAFDDNAL